MACRLAIALLLAANVHEPRRIHLQVFTSGSKTPSPRLLQMTYYFVAMSGGIYNTRMVGSVGIPTGVNPAANGHEFSGIVDFSGMLATDAWGNFVCSAGDGECKRAAEATVPINDKMIVLGLQAHNYWGGLISYFNADRGGQAYAYKPELP